MNNESLRASTIAEIVNQLPGSIPVFEKFNIDFCCNGRMPFPEACERAGVQPDGVLIALQAPSANNPVIRAQDWSLDLLTNYLVQNHHQYTKRALSEIQPLVEKVVVRHGVHHPELAEIREQFQTLSKDLQTHMYHEEHVLFPAVNALVKESARVLPSTELSSGPTSNLNPVIVTMETEHELAGHCLLRIRNASQHFTLPPDACNAFTSLYRRLEELEADLHIHIHLENNLLFPKALALQARQQEKPLYVN